VTTLIPRIRSLRFAVSLRQRSRQMECGLHDETDPLAMRLAAQHIAHLAAELATALAIAEEAVGQRDAARAARAA
jgi:hypothetical protein